jgi:hypothetical protein
MISKIKKLFKLTTSLKSLNNNFQKIDFFGIFLGLMYKKSTTILYRNNNCLDI